MCHVRGGVEDEENVLERKHQERQSMIRFLRKVFLEADVDGSGCVTFAEFKSILDQPNLKLALEALDLHMEEVQKIFTLLDTENDGHIEIDEFVNGCMKAKGDAKGMDMLVLMSDQRKRTSRIEAKQEELMQ